MTRITDLSMSAQDVLIALAEGNPGAITAMIELMKGEPEIDPDSAWGGWGPLFTLDTNEIYGSHIWILYKDLCGQSVPKTLAVLRAIQLGIVPHLEVRAAIDRNMWSEQWGNTTRADELLAKVREKLPRFAASVLTDPTP